MIEKKKIKNWALLQCTCKYTGMEQEERKKDPSTAAVDGGGDDDGRGNSSSGGGGKDNNIANNNNDDNGNTLSNDHMAAMAGWKARKEQLHRQQKSVDRANNEAEKVNLVSLSKKNKKKDDSGYYN